MINGAARLYISTIILGGFYYLAYLYLTGGVHTDANTSTTVGQILGNAGTLAAGVCGYWVGSSKGSEDKNSTIANIADRLPSSPPRQTAPAAATTPTQEKSK